ncbi:hypothetical protein F4821DRAFT_234419, partial [Hypoxylon rubiginosum]
MAAKQKDIVAFKCTIQDIKSDKNSLRTEEFEVKKTEILRGFEARIRHEQHISGKITWYKAKSGNSSAEDVPGDKIFNDMITIESLLCNRKQLFLKFDPNISVAAGGYGDGAEGVSGDKKPIASDGGIGQGATSSPTSLQGGSGYGGHGHGRNFVGKAGKGFGGNANAIKNANGPARTTGGGAGYGGNVLHEEI